MNHFVNRIQDSISMQERINRAASIEQEQVEIERRLNKLKQSVVVSASRDPQRLLKLTAGWEERKKAHHDRHEHTGSVLHVSRR